MTNYQHNLEFAAPYIEQIKRIAKANTCNKDIWGIHAKAKTIYMIDPVHGVTCVNANVSQDALPIISFDAKNVGYGGTQAVINLDLQTVDIKPGIGGFKQYTIGRMDFTPGSISLSINTPGNDITIKALVPRMSASIKHVFPDCDVDIIIEPRENLLITAVRDAAIHAHNDSLNRARAFFNTNGYWRCMTNDETLYIRHTFNEHTAQETHIDSTANPPTITHSCYTPASDQSLSVTLNTAQGRNNLTITRDNMQIATAHISHVSCARDLTSIQVTTNTCYYDTLINSQDLIAELCDVIFPGTEVTLAVEKH